MAVVLVDEQCLKTKHAVQVERGCHEFKDAKGMVEYGALICLAGALNIISSCRY